MPKKALQVLIFLSVLGLLFFGGCKTSEEASQYTLSVTVAQGVSGTPAAGSTGHAEGDMVNYNYSLQAGYENLVVKLDGATVANSGVITMNQNHTLTVTADEKFNPTGDWKGYLYYTTSLDLVLEVTFSGNYAGGTTSGEYSLGGSSSGIGTGTYSISGNDITFTLEYTGGTFTLWGTIANDDNMSGKWEANPGGVTGTWTLTRQ
jgi:hypothetical protein